MLRAVEIPPVGGNTLWADMGAAYDLLPDELKAPIGPLLAEHDWMQSVGRPMLQDALDLLRPQFMPVQHPVVRVIPEAGRGVLFVNIAFTHGIVGMPEAESNALLTQLYRHVQRLELQVRLRWQPYTGGMWDHRTCQHYAASDYYPARRDGPHFHRRRAAGGDWYAGRRGARGRQKTGFSTRFMVVVQ